MKCLSICIVFLACLVMKANSEAILCYECDDCGDLSDTQLVSCPLAATTTQPPSSTTDDGSTDPPTTTTIEPTTTTTTTTIEPTTTTTTIEPTTTTTTTTIEPTTTTTTTTTVANRKRDVANLLHQSSRQLRSLRSILRAEPTYECYSLEKIDGNSRKVKRGCVEVPETKEACETIKSQVGGTIENCYSCKTNKCNSSAGLKLSLATFFIALVIGVIYK